MASLQTSDSELVTLNFIRNQYEKKHKQNVPMALKYLTIQFSKRIIGCKLLSIKQDLDFFNLLSTKLPSIRRFNFLFRTSDHNYSGKKFHDFCDDKGGTITIIKTNWGNIFGGYTSKSWTSENKWIADKDAFLFLIKSDDESTQSKCPLLLELRKGDIHVNYAIGCNPSLGPIFGLGYDIIIRDECNRIFWRNSYMMNSSEQFSYDTPKVNICGGDRTDSYKKTKYLFQVIDYEVYQIV